MYISICTGCAKDDYFLAIVFLNHKDFSWFDRMFVVQVDGHKHLIFLTYMHAFCPPPCLLSIHLHNDYQIILSVFLHNDYKVLSVLLHNDYKVLSVCLHNDYKVILSVLTSFYFSLLCISHSFSFSSKLSEIRLFPVTKNDVVKFLFGGRLIWDKRICTCWVGDDCRRRGIPDHHQEIQNKKVTARN